MMFSILVSSKYISIHALREEGDVQRQYVYQEF